MGEKELNETEVEAYRKEVAAIKDEAMRKELEEIKKDKLRNELEDIKRERSQDEQPAAQVRRLPTSNPSRPLWLTMAIGLGACLMCLASGLLIGMLISSDTGTPIDSLVKSYNLPISGTLILAGIAIVLAAGGMWIISTVRK